MGSSVLAIAVWVVVGKKGIPGKGGGAGCPYIMGDRVGIRGELGEEAEMR